VGLCTSLANGIANFATIFILIELDERLAEALSIKILQPKRRLEESQDNDPLLPTKDQLPEGSAPAAAAGGGDGDGQASQKKKKRSCSERMCDDQCITYWRYFLFLIAFVVYLGYSFFLYSACDHAPWSDCNGVKVLTTADLKDEAATRALLQGWWDMTGATTDALPYLCSDMVYFDISNNGTIIITQFGPSSS